MKVSSKYSTILLINNLKRGEFSMNVTIVIILSLLSLSLIYFLLKVCIQFNRINNLNLLLGMDVTKLYDIDSNSENDFYPNYLVTKVAMRMYILSKNVKST